MILLPLLKLLLTHKTLLRKQMNLPLKLKFVTSSGLFVSALFHVEIASAFAVVRTCRLLCCRCRLLSVLRPDAIRAPRFSWVERIIGFLLLLLLAALALALAFAGSWSPARLLLALIVL